MRFRNRRLIGWPLLALSIPFCMGGMCDGNTNTNTSPTANLTALPESIEDADNDGSELVMLDGSSSTDPDGMIVSYLFSEGSTVFQDGPFATVDVALDVGQHSIQLEVTDNQGATATDTVTVIVTLPPTPPLDPLIAEAGPPKTRSSSDASVTLEGSASGGSGSYDFAWSPATDLSDPTTAQPTASPATSTTYSLTVTDAITKEIATDIVTVTVIGAMLTDLVAEAGDFQFLPTDASTASVQLDGSMSTGEPPLSFIWSYINGPLLTSPPQIEDAAVPAPFGLPLGVHTIQLTADDSTDRAVVTDDIKLTVFLGSNPERNPTPSGTICTKFQGNCMEIDPIASFAIRPPSGDPRVQISGIDLDPERTVFVPDDLVAITDADGVNYIELTFEGVEDASTVPGDWHQSQNQISAQSCDSPSCPANVFPPAFSSDRNVTALLSEGVHYIVHTATNPLPDGIDMLSIHEVKLTITITP